MSAVEKEITRAETQRRSGWEERKAKYLWQQITTPSSSSRKIGLENLESFMGRFIESEAQFEGNGVAFEQGDILYGKLRPYLAKVWVAEFAGNAVGDFFVYRLNGGIDAHYMQYYMLSSQFTANANASTYGARMPRVSAEYMANCPIPFPPLPEQKAIVAYLDAETGRIDKAIAEEEKMIALLQERREIVINEAVGGGEDFNAEAQRRRGWEWRRLKTLATCNDEVLPESTSDFARIEYIEISDVDESRGIFNSTFHVFKDAPSRARRITREGDVIISTVRTYLKAIATIEREGLVVSTGFAVLRARSCILPRFLAYAVKSAEFKDKVVRHSTGTSYPAINTSDLMCLSVPLPPLHEQEEIVKRLDCETGKIDRAIEVKRRQIELLRERRQIVIDEAVTGKVKVV